ncbi:MAG: hypothetical protein ABEL51_00450 [Salinibacter sp.]
MSTDLSAEETVVFAIYSTRSDAEAAHDYLQGEGIEAFVRADDGDMPPDMERPDGAKLVGRREAAQDAYEVLNEADLLPETVEEAERAGASGASAEAEGLTMSLSGAFGLAGFAAVVLIVLYYLFVM